MLERRVQLLVEPQIQVEQCAFHPCHGTLDQLYTLVRVLEGPWEFAQPVLMCFVGLEKAYDRILQGVLWGEQQEYGVDNPFFTGHSISILSEPELGSDYRQ